MGQCIRPCALKLNEICTVTASRETACVMLCGKIQFDDDGLKDETTKSNGSGHNLYRGSETLILQDSSVQLLL